MWNRALVAISLMLYPLADAIELYRARSGARRSDTLAARVHAAHWGVELGAQRAHSHDTLDSTTGVSERARAQCENDK